MPIRCPSIPAPTQLMRSQSHRRRVDCLLLSVLPIPSTTGTARSRIGRQSELVNAAWAIAEIELRQTPPVEGASGTPGSVGSNSGLMAQRAVSRPDKVIAISNWPPTAQILGPWTSTTSGANVMRAPAPADGAVAIGQDGEDQRSWT